MQSHHHQAGLAIVRDLRDFLGRIAVGDEGLGMKPARHRRQQFVQAVLGHRAAIRSTLAPCSRAASRLFSGSIDVDEDQRNAERFGDAARNLCLMHRRRREIHRNDDPAEEPLRIVDRNGPGSCGGVTSTGRVVSRSTRSVVDPKNSLRMPVSPCELMTIRSHERSRATRRISGAGLPTATSYSSAAAIGESAPNVLSAKCRISRLSLRRSRDAGAQIEGLGQQRILDRQHDQAGREVGRDRGRIAQRARGGIREIDRTQDRWTNIHGGLLAGFAQARATRVPPGIATDRRAFSPPFQRLRTSRRSRLGVERRGKIPRTAEKSARLRPARDGLYRKFADKSHERAGTAVALGMDARRLTSSL